MNRIVFTPEEEAKRKGMFLQALKDAGGIIAAACENSKVSYSVFKRWRKQDPLFAEQVEEVGEAQFGFVENKLMQQINAGDTTSIIFYLKTKGKGKGYTQRADKPTDLEKEEADEKRLEDMHRMVDEAKAAIKAALIEKGVYSAMLDFRVDTTAMLYAQTRSLFNELTAKGSVVNIETTREGDKRETLSPLYVAYLRSAKQLNESLSGLGIEVKSEATIEQDDNLSKFIESIRDDARGEE